MRIRTGDIIGLVLLAGVAVCRYWRPAADFYAERCYPPVSAALSGIASLVHFSLEEIVVGCFVLAFLVVLIRAIVRKDGFFRWLLNTLRVVMWLVIWTDLAWGCNYFRTPLYERLEITPSHFEQTEFERFLSDYTRTLNESAGSASGWEQSAIEQEIKDFYGGRAAECGYAPLRKWQHAKKPLLNPVYSAVTVLGWMGPFFCETQVNLDLPELEYPSVLAHETAHLAGVTGEGEANYWAYAFCRQSDNPAVRYSGCLELFPYVAANARALMTEERYNAWLRSVSTRAKEDYNAIQEFWEGKRVGIIEKVQRFIMDLMLKSNGISEGAKDYSGVIGIIMTLDGYFGDSPAGPALPSAPVSPSEPSEPSEPSSTDNLPRMTA